MPRRRSCPKPAADWFERLPEDALVRELRVVSGPENESPLIDVGKETLRRYGLEGKAPRAVTIGATRHYRVGELRRWLRGEWVATADIGKELA